MAQSRAQRLKVLFGKGILRSRGSGKNREVTYDKKRSRELRGREKATRSKGASSGLKRNIGRAQQNAARRRAGNANSGNPFAGRAVIGGSKATGLRSGMGGKPRAERIAAGRAKAQEYLSSEKGQRLTSGVQALRNANRRTGRRDYDKEKKVKAAKDDVRAAGVKIKTANALSKKYDLPRLRGQYSDRTIVRDSPRLAEQKRLAARKTERAAAREAVIAPVRGKSRAERIAAGRAVAESSPRVKGYRYVKQQAAADAAAKVAQAQRTARLTGRTNRVNRLAVKQAKQQEVQAQAFAKRQAVRNKRLAGAGKITAQKDRAARIAKGRSVLTAFRKRRDSQYSGSLF